MKGNDQTHSFILFERDGVSTAHAAQDSSITRGRGVCLACARATVVALKSSFCVRRETHPGTLHKGIELLCEPGTRHTKEKLHDAAKFDRLYTTFLQEK